MNVLHTYLLSQLNCTELIQKLFTKIQFGIILKEH